jgi:hypothetical protein
LALRENLDVPFEQLVRDCAGDGVDLDEALDMTITAALEVDNS